MNITEALARSWQTTSRWTEALTRSVAGESVGEVRAVFIQLRLLPETFRGAGALIIGSHAMLIADASPSGERLIRLDLADIGHVGVASKQGLSGFESLLVESRDGSRHWLKGVDIHPALDALQTALGVAPRDAWWTDSSLAWPGAVHLDYWGGLHGRTRPRMNVEVEFGPAGISAREHRTAVAGLLGGGVVGMALAPAWTLHLPWEQVESINVGTWEDVRKYWGNKSPRQLRSKVFVTFETLSATAIFASDGTLEALETVFNRIVERHEP